MKRLSRLIAISLFVGILVLVGGFFIDLAPTTMASNQTSTDISLGVDSSQRVVINLYYDSQEQLNAVAGELDIWEVHPLPGIGPGSGYAVAAVIPAQQDWLESLGYRVEVDQEQTAILQSPEAVLDPRYYYFDNFYTNPNNLYMVNFMQETNVNYPALTEMIDIGDAWAASHGGHQRDIWVLRITNEDPAYGDILSKPPFFLFANVHAREVTTPEMAIRYIKYFTAGYNGEGGYGVDPDVTWMVNHHVVYVLVTINPDGHVVNEPNTGAYWRKNVDNDDGCSTTYGTDLNRNSSFFWGCCGGSSGNPCSETYRGPSRASEPETSAFQDYFVTVFTDSNGENGDDNPVLSPNDAPGLFISLHSYQDEILWPFGCRDNPNCGEAPNNAQLQTIGRKLADITGVMYPSGFLYTVDGSTDDWVYGRLGVAAFTYEIGPTYGTCADFFPPYGCQDGIDGMPRNFWAEMGPSFVYANKIAATPYITAYGPDTQSLVVTPSSAPVGQLVDLTGTVLDQRYSSDPLQPISAAEYFIDAPGADGTGLSLDPTDGSWGETSEDVVASVDTTGLSLGQHYILVHGMNDDGIWGPFTAVFLTIIEPTAPDAEFTSNSPVAFGDPVLFTNLTTGSEPITYLWDFGDGDTSTEVNPSHTYTAIGTYTVTLYATNELGSDSVSHPVEVVPVDIANVNLTVITPGPIYIGDPVEFSADLSPDNATKPYDYTIDYGDGTFEDGTSSDDPILFNHTFASGGSYTVSIEVINIGMTVPATDVLEITILVPESPVAGYTSNSPVQIGDPIQFTNSSTGSPIPTYLWDFGDGSPPSTLENPSHTYSEIAEYIVTLTATNRFGTNTFSDTVSVEPRDFTQVNLSLISTEPIYTGATVEFSADLLPNNATKPYTYTLDFGDGNSETNTSSLDPLPFTHVYTVDGDRIVTIEVINAGMTIPVTDSLALTVILVVEPIAEFTSNSPVIIGQPVNFTNLSLGTEPLTYAWDFGDGVGASTDSNPSYTYAEVGTYTVTLEATNQFGSATVSHPVTVDPIAFTGVNLNLVTPGIIYAGQTVEFSANLLPDIATKPYDYTILYGDGISTTGTSSDDPLYFTHIYALRGNYDVQIEVTNGSPLGPVSDTLNLIVLPPLEPVAEFTSNSPVYLGQSVLFTNQSTGLEPLSFAWDFGDGETSVAVNPSHTYATIGTYTVTLEATNNLGISAISHAVTVIAPQVSITGVELTQVTPGLVFAGDLVEFSADLLPDDADKPFTYTVDYGDGTTLTDVSSFDPLPLSHVYLAAGGYTVFIEVSNENMETPVSDSLDVMVSFGTFLPLVTR